MICACSDDNNNKPKADARVDARLPDGPSADKAQPDGPAADASTEPDCKGQADGTACGEGLICVKEACASSTCGDGFIDKDAGEDCEDGNSDPADGCSSCRFLCKANPDCDDKQTCNGEETCDTAAHVCKPGTPVADGTACGTDQVCFGGVCSTVGCGNGNKDTGEECDDGNKIDGDGCDNTCKFSCQDDAACDDGDACNGKETCAKDPAKQVCTAAAALNCDDGQLCTTDSCDPLLGCVNTPLDKDGDKHSCADDCDDANPSVFAGAPECADGVDNDCDGEKDEAPLSEGKCWADLDGDGYALASAATINNCVCPAGYTNVDPTVANMDDCFDRANSTAAADANPDQTEFREYGYCTGKMVGGVCNTGVKYDWNCDGVEQKRWSTLAAASGCKVALGTRCLGAGWSTAVPACGAPAAKYTVCTLDKASGQCLGSEILQKQACR